MLTEAVHGILIARKGTHMAQTISAIYENGVLRPTIPLELPEHARVELELRPVARAASGVEEALVAAGLMLPGGSSQGVHTLSDGERDDIARRNPSGKPLSEIIIEEREGR